MSQQQQQQLPATLAGDTANNATATAWPDASTSWRRMQYYLRARFLLDRGKLRAHEEVVVVGAGSNKQPRHVSNSSSSSSRVAADYADDADAFVDAVVRRQLLYFSYRYQFAPLPNAMTCDAGWGCLLRTGQMLLAHALVRHDTCDAVVRGSIDDAALARVRGRVRALFMDTPAAPFGIHALQRHLHAGGVAYGTLLTPTQMGMALAAATTAAAAATMTTTAVAHGVRRPLVALCCAGGDVDATRVQHLLHGADKNTQQPSSSPLSPHGVDDDSSSSSTTTTIAASSVLLLIPLNLGLGELSTKYAETLRRVLAMRSACGAAGGTRATSVLYIGYQRDTLLYLDPHYMQHAYTSPSTYGRRTPLRAQLPLRESNTSLLLGCYLHDRAALDTFAAELQHVNAPLLFPLVSLVTATRDMGSARTESNGNENDSMQPFELLTPCDDGDETAVVTTTTTAAAASGGAARCAPTS